MLIWGMLLQAVAIALLVPASTFMHYVSVSIGLGLGTALVYPTLLASISEFSPPQQRAECIGIFRLWRDLGYAFGALITGIVADALGINQAVFVVGGLTFLSALILKLRMD